MTSGAGRARRREIDGAGITPESVSMGLSGSEGHPRIGASGHQTSRRRPSRSRLLPDELPICVGALLGYEAWARQCPTAAARLNHRINLADFLTPLRRDSMLSPD